MRGFFHVCAREYSDDMDKGPANSDTPETNATGHDASRHAHPSTPDDPATVSNEEVVLHDGESVTLNIPSESTTHLVVNVVQPPRATGFFGSCMQGCGCLVIVAFVLAAIGSFLP
jgi:hypothetical protein